MELPEVECGQHADGPVPRHQGPRPPQLGGVDAEEELLAVRQGHVVLEPGDPGPGLAPALAGETDPCLPLPPGHLLRQGRQESGRLEHPEEAYSFSPLPQGVVCLNMTSVL